MFNPFNKLAINNQQLAKCRKKGEKKVWKEGKKERKVTFSYSNNGICKQYHNTKHHSKNRHR